MNYWDFTSDNNWFSLRLPKNWSEYDDADDTFAFFNTEKWSGNLRISHIRTISDEPWVDKPSKALEYELLKNANSIKIKLNGWDAVFHSRQNQDLMVYYWTTDHKNDLFVCSFTFNMEFLNSNWHKDEIITVGEILNSIKIIG